MRRSASGLSFVVDGAASLHVFPVEGIAEVTPADDLATLILAARPDLRDDDVVVVTSKVVSKSEGRVRSDCDRATAIADETVRVVASRGDLQIVQTRQGLVLAAAGVDASNTAPGSLVLLPKDPDASARRLRRALSAQTGRRLAVVITDSAGRPWRVGQTDIAIGVAGLHASVPHTGVTDPYGNVLSVTEPAVADEIAGAANLVLGKTSNQPVAVVRGLGHLVTDDDGPGAAALVRPAPDDLFALGTHSVLGARRTVREFADRAVSDEDLDAAVAEAVTAPAPHHTRPWRFVTVGSQTRTRLLDRMADQWRSDLHGDGSSESAIERRLRRGELLRQAPILVVPCLVTEGAHTYPDARRSEAERSMFWLSMGAGIENFLVALATRGVGSAWVGSTLFCADVVRTVLRLPSSWHPAGAVAIGYAAATPPPREPHDPSDYRIDR